MSINANYTDWNVDHTESSRRKNNDKDLRQRKREFINKLRHARTIEEQLVEFSEVPRVLEENPIPDIIQLAENNKLRRCIVEVFKKTKTCFTQSNYSVFEQVVKNIFFLLENQNTDPEARSLSLRALGCLSILLTDNIDIHTGILQRLDSKVEIEANAAIYAVDKICSKSQAFATLTCDKLAIKLQSKEISETFKLKLIRVLRHMHWEANLAHKTRCICLELLENETDEKVILTISKTLTYLSCRAPSDSSEQVNYDYVTIIDLLIIYVSNCSYENVKISALNDIMKLTRVKSIFEVSQVLKLLNLVNGTTEKNVKIKLFRILTFLFKQRKILAGIMSCISDKNARIEAICYMQKYIELIHPYWEEVAVITVKFFIAILNEAERIEETTSHSIGNEWDELFAEVSKVILMASELRGSITQTLNNKILAIIKYKELLQMPKSFSIMAKVILRTHSFEVAKSEEFQNMFIQLLKEFGQCSKNRSNQWLIYLIGVEAGKSGCCNIMASIMNNFIAEVDVDSIRNWFRALYNVGSGGNYIMISKNKTQMQSKDVFDLMGESIRHYSICDAELNGFMSLTDTCNQRFFSRWYCQLRCNYLSTMRLLLEEATKNPGDTSSFDVSMKFIHVELMRTADLHSFVARSFFDIDEDTFSHVVQCLTIEDEKWHNKTAVIPFFPLTTNEVLSVIYNYLLDILSIPVNIPPFFFNRQRGTYLQWPKMPTIEVIYDSQTKPDEPQFVLKLEGVVNPSQNSTRKVKSLQFIIFCSNENFLEFANPEDTIYDNYVISEIALKHFKEKDPTVTTIYNHPLNTFNSNSFVCNITLTLKLIKKYLNIHINLVDFNDESWTIGPD
ncbi:7271_t:CDS:10, partial [Diversispora eburnea]